MSGCSTTQLSKLIRGDSRAITVTITDQDGTPVDITGKPVVLTISETLQGTPVIQKTNTVHTNPTAGITSFEITPMDSIGCKPMNHHIDIVAYLSNISIHTVYIGDVKVENRVSIPE